MSLPLFNSQGPMAPRVADLRVAFEVMCRPSGRDPWHVAAPVAGPPVADPLRVTVALPAQTDPAIADGVRRVCLRPPFRAGADIDSAESVREILASMQAVVGVNLLGLPSIAVPVGSAPDGLPLGVQVIGPRFREDLCLDAGAALESAFGTLTPMDPR